jgi:K+/H+ antiporter YhaU regulatory subunit KhtT
LQYNNAFDVEIIYHSTAIDYLQKNDPSLRESMGLASEMGFSLDKLNSEVLASILASEYARTDFEELESEVSDLIEELLEEEESEEEEN